ncbi:MAG: hypothetical protein QJR02_08280 [Sinobacteraceae bacterium]|nr:hypothetical protein [Nevskiaceae bacterium]
MSDTPVEMVHVPIAEYRRAVACVSACRWLADSRDARERALGKAALSADFAATHCAGFDLFMAAARPAAQPAVAPNTGSRGAGRPAHGRTSARVTRHPSTSSQPARTGRSAA